MVLFLIFFAKYCKKANIIEWILQLKHFQSYNKKIKVVTDFFTDISIRK